MLQTPELCTQRSSRNIDIIVVYRKKKKKNATFLESQTETGKLEARSQTDSIAVDVLADSAYQHFNTKELKQANMLIITGC